MTFQKGHTLNKGKKFSKEHRKKLSLVKKGKPGNAFGKHWKIKDTSKYGKYWLGKKRPILAKRMTGENSPCWIKDRTKLAKRQKRNDGAYREWRLNVYKRDNYKCRLCNKDCSGRINAHHILSWSQFPELRYEVNNGITLCQFHHPRKRNDEKILSFYFQELVKVKV